MSALEPVAPGVRRLAVRTPTLPPATHTNAYVLGRSDLTVVDPASPYDDEQRRLATALDADGGRVTRIVLTHHHVDHVSGAVALQAHLARAGRRVPIVAHAVTRRLLDGMVAVDETVGQGDVVDTDAGVFDVLHTPGHAPGHVVLHDREAGTMVAGDMVAGVGTILIDPAEGDLASYLASLHDLASRDPTVLLPSHGPVLTDAPEVLAFYVAHRHMRTDQIRDALRGGEAVTPLGLAPTVYAELPPEAHPLAAIQIRAHLHWLQDAGEVVRVGEAWRISG